MSQTKTTMSIPCTVTVRGVSTSAVFALLAPDSDRDHGAWRNGVLTIAGRDYSVGGGHIHTDDSAAEQNRCNGLQPEQFPHMDWPGAASAGDIEPYQGYECGDCAGVARAILGERRWSRMDSEQRDAAEHELWPQVQRLTRDVAKAEAN